MNKFSVTMLLVSALAAFANADSQKDIEIAKEIGPVFGKYVVRQEAMVRAEHKLGNVNEIFLNLPTSENFDFRESESPKGVYAVAKKAIGKCPKGGKWLITSRLKGETLKFECQIDAGCESLTPTLKSVCGLDVNLNDSQVELEIKLGTLKDSRDGNVYKTVKYGSSDLTWMAENLNYKTDGSRCLLDKKANCQKYGRLYTWNAAMKACPTGWRVPGPRDWIGLFIEAGWDGEKEGPKKEILEIGKKLKSKNGWKKNGNGTDNLRFAALPGGLANVSKNMFLEDAAAFWSSFESPRGDVLTYWVTFVRDDVLPAYAKKDDFLSVRCVKGGEKKQAKENKSPENPPAKKNSDVEIGKNNSGSALSLLVTGENSKGVNSYTLSVSVKDIQIISSGNRIAKNLEKVAQQRNPGLKHVYKKFWDMKAGFSGNVVLKLTIAPNGDVISCSIESSTTRYSDFDKEIEKTVSRWVFDKSDANTVATISFSFSKLQ